MITEEKKQEYIQGWKKRKSQKQKEIKEKKKIAHHKVNLVVQKLKNDYKIERVVLFGSLAEDKFWEHSDIDLAVSGFREQDYLKIWDELREIAAPFELDLILIEDAPDALLKKIKEKGIDLK